MTLQDPRRYNQAATAAVLAAALDIDIVLLSDGRVLALSDPRPLFRKRRVQTPAKETT